MNQKIKIHSKILIIIGFILILLLNFCYFFPTIRDGLYCKHDTLVETLNLIAKWIQYIGIAGGILFVIISQYKDKNYYNGIKIAILVAIIIPLVLLLCTYFVQKYDSNNDNCTLGTNWKEIPTFNP